MSCGQLKLKARDIKFYNTDVVDESGLNTVIALIPRKKSDPLCVKGIADPKKTYSLIKEAPTDDIHNREIIMKVIDYLYCYEIEE